MVDITPSSHRPCVEILKMASREPIMVRLNRCENWADSQRRTTRATTSWRRALSIVTATHLVDEGPLDGRDARLDAPQDVVVGSEMEPPHFGAQPPLVAEVETRLVDEDGEDVDRHLVAVLLRRRPTSVHCEDARSEATSEKY